MCLNFVQREEEEEWHPALGFCNQVVVPLEKCATVLEISFESLQNSRSI